MKALRWTQVTLSIPLAYQDLLVGQLAALGFGGFLQEEASLKGYIEGAKWNRELEHHLHYYLQKFGAEFPHLRIRTSSASIRQQNWNQKWESSIGIIDVAPGIVIKPSWKRLRVRDKGKIILHVDPKMSFGTGHHETTRLCLQMLHKYVQPRMTVLDFGGGTGILAIAAIKLGAGRAVAIDHDEWTIPNIKENLKRNRVKHRVKVILGTVNSIPMRSFDLIVANIDFPTIVKAQSRFAARLKKGGLLILSGILTTDLLTLHRHLRHRGMTPLDIVIENEWAAITLIRT
jgi:ribosomal protein L11 methyltransferase